MTRQLGNKNRIYLVVLLFVGGLTLGCARDNQRNLVSDFFEPPSSRAMDEIKPQPKSPVGANSSVVQTSYEAQISDPQWLTSLPEAISQAQSESKLILLDFTGSDWCHYCVKLKKEVFDSPDFKAWASDNVVLLEIDFPRRSQLPPKIQQQNEMLKSRYEISSYPTVLLVDPEGNVKAKMGYQNGQSPAQWVQMAESRLQSPQNAERLAGRVGSTNTR